MITSVQSAFFVGAIHLYCLREQPHYFFKYQLGSCTSFVWSSSLWCCRNSIGHLGHTRFYNFHGEPQARLERDQSVYGYLSGQRTWLIKIFSNVLFSVPEAHLQNLQKLQVDRILYKYDWDRTMEAIKEEWTKLTLLVSISSY
jgi:hypothetical protein